jgi:hypothetical protein
MVRHAPPDVLGIVGRSSSVKVFLCQYWSLLVLLPEHRRSCRLPQPQTGVGHGDGTPVSKLFDESTNPLAFLTPDLSVSVGRWLTPKIHRFVVAPSRCLLCCDPQSPACSRGAACVAHGQAPPGRISSPKCRVSRHSENGQAVSGAQPRAGVGIRMRCRGWPAGRHPQIQNSFVKLS